MFTWGGPISFPQDAVNHTRDGVLGYGKSAEAIVLDSDMPVERGIYPRKGRTAIRLLRMTGSGERWNANRKDLKATWNEGDWKSR